MPQNLKYNLYYNYFKITSIYHGSLFFGKIDVWERFCAMVWWKTTFNFSSSNSLLYSNQTRVETSEWPLAIFVFKSQRLPSCQLIILNHSPTTVWRGVFFFFLQTYVVFLVVYISLMFGSYNISLFYSSFVSFMRANMWSLSSSAALTYHMTFRKPQQCDDDDEDMMMMMMMMLTTTMMMTIIIILIINTNTIVINIIIIIISILQTLPIPVTVEHICYNILL